MRITSRQLRQIIKEELRRTLREGDNSEPDFSKMTRDQYYEYWSASDRAEAEAHKTIADLQEAESVIGPKILTAVMGPGTADSSLVAAIAMIKNQIQLEEVEKFIKEKTGEDFAEFISGDLFEITDLEMIYEIEDLLNNVTEKGSWSWITGTGFSKTP